MKSRGLLIIDVQNDFCSNGALAVPEGDAIIPALNKYIARFSKKKLPIFASRDWHPKITSHFKKYGGVWPAHCMQKTNGARFHPKLKLPKSTFVVSKGMKKHGKSYSAFSATEIKKQFSLLTLLKMHNVKELYIGGLATDYCVKASVLDALRMKFEVKLLTDAIRGVDVNPGDSKKAISELTKRGAKKITFSRLKI